jgi:hypothetical protein
VASAWRAIGRLIRVIVDASFAGAGEQLDQVDETLRIPFSDPFRRDGMAAAKHAGGDGHTRWTPTNYLGELAPQMVPHKGLRSRMGYARKNLISLQDTSYHWLKHAPAFV